MIPLDDTHSREDDEDIARMLLLVQANWCLADIATDLERDTLWVIEALYAHRDCFRPEFQQ